MLFLLEKKKNQVHKQGRSSLQSKQFKMNIPRLSRSAFFVFSILTYPVIVYSCEDIASGGLDVGWDFEPTCKAIKKKYSHLCDTRINVKVNCAKSCETCAFDPLTECKDTKGNKLSDVCI